MIQSSWNKLACNYRDGMAQVHKLEEGFIFFSGAFLHGLMRIRAIGFRRLKWDFRCIFRSTAWKCAFKNGVFWQTMYTCCIWKWIWLLLRNELHNILSLDPQDIERRQLRCPRNTAPICLRDGVWNILAVWVWPKSIHMGDRNDLPNHSTALCSLQNKYT